MFIVVMAGFSGSLFNSVRLAINKERSDFIFPGHAVKTSSPFVYRNDYISFLTGEVQKTAAPIVGGDRGVFLCLLYFMHDEHKRLVNAFCPTAINFGLPKELLYEGDRNATAKVISKIRDFQRATTALNKIFTQEIRRTPWLLPFDNYRISAYKDAINAAARCEDSEIYPCSDVITKLPKAVSLRPKVTVYTDDREVLFIPAKFSNFHGYDIKWTDSQLWLKGVFRLGRSIPVGFHYDARRNKGRLDSIYFVDCESGRVRARRGDDYINITPNDRIRLGQRSA